MAITKTQRWLDLIAFLVKRRLPVSVEDLMEGVPAYAVKWRTEDAKARATVRRMFERDKDELRAAGIPLESVQYTINYGAETVDGYRLSGRDFYLPYLRIVGESAEGAEGAEAGRARPAHASGAMEVRITPEDAALTIDALRRVADLPDSPFAAEARSALAKLRFDLEPPVVADDGVERATVLFAEPAAPYPVSATLGLLTDALRARKRVRFRYHGIRRGEATDRDVAPYGLLHQRGQWYLIGHDATRHDIRVFRLSRMEGPAVGKGDGPEYEHDPDFSVAAYAQREPWELGDDEPVSFDVRFDFPLALWADRNHQGEPVEELAGGAVVRRFDVRQTGPFLRWLQSFGGDAIVVAPPDMRQAQAAMARDTLAAYGV